MGSFSIWHWIIVLVIILPNILIAPAVKKAGFNKAWAYISIIPGVGLVLLWIFAFAKWPNHPDR